MALQGSLGVSSLRQVFFAFTCVSLIRFTSPFIVQGAGADSALGSKKNFCLNDSEDYTLGYKEIYPREPHALW